MCRKKVRFFKDNSFKNCSYFLCNFSFFVPIKKSNFSENQSCQFFQQKRKGIPIYFFLTFGTLKKLQQILELKYED